MWIVIESIGIPRYLQRLNTMHRSIATGLIPFCCAFAFIFIVDNSHIFAQPTGAQNHSADMITGMTHEGKIGNIGKISEALNEIEWGGDTHLIFLIDDGLRRVFVNKHRIARYRPVEKRMERFEIWQKSTGGITGIGIGSIISKTQFDEFGRRMITARVATRVGVIFQGITEINPHYCVVETINSENGEDIRLDMRIATSSVPIDTLLKILKRQIKDPESQAERLRIVDFLIQAGKFRVAEREIQRIRAEFPDLHESLKIYQTNISREVARQAADEMRKRWEVGQRQFAIDLLQIALKATSDTRSLATFEALRDEFKRDTDEVAAVKQFLTKDIEAALLSDKIDAATKATITNFKDTVLGEFTIDNIGRMDAYKNIAPIADKPITEKISLGMSCWYVGSGQATENLAISESFPPVHKLVVEYLQTKDPGRREQILEELLKYEGGAPKYISAIIAHIKPPIPVDLLPAAQGKPIELTLDIPLPGNKLGNEPVQCLVQLPPEYDPYRWYPAIVALANPGATPDNQIDWWCGPLDEQRNMRHGQATRHGYIVIAPQWNKHGQTAYEYNAREHLIVLKSLRESLRRFSIDPDRVFLAGHGVGGDAAIDIGLAHPEYWAGVIPVSSRIERYPMFYWVNAGGAKDDRTVGAGRLPMYFVQGERDFDAIRNNSTEWNRWLRDKQFDVTVVEYKGRGDDFFYDEIHYFFDWMDSIQDRLSLPEIQQFKCSILRPWDNYHYWYEGHGFDPNLFIFPDEWPLITDREDRVIECEVDVAENTYKITRLGERATVWLSPEITDFNRPITFRSKDDETFEVSPSRRIILEDVRRRADRQHPFWAKVSRIKARWIEPDTVEANR